MSNASLNRIFILAFCGAVLYLLLTFTSNTSGTASEKDNGALKRIETAGSQLLWESLSHQFVSSVQY